MWYYLLFINIVGFIIMGLDKDYARKRKRRIPEKTLFLVAILGGSLGSIIGMNTFRHKTRHKQFTIGMPLILVLQIIIFCIIILNS